MKIEELTNSETVIESVWYRSFMPDGRLWCETRSFAELMEQAKHYQGEGKLTHTDVLIVVTRYAPVVRKLSKKKIKKRKKELGL